MTITQLHGDCRTVLTTLPDASVQCIVTSPPYWRLRRYTDSPDEIGQEDTPAAYVEALRSVFAECRRVLRPDGVLWLNLGDAYARSGGTDRKPSASAQVGSTRRTLDQIPERNQRVPDGLPAKNLIGLPWRVAFALQDDGWILRSEIIWHKPNAMPESVTDRPTRDHETLFLLSRSPRYYYDADAIRDEWADKRKGASGAKTSKFIAPGARRNDGGITQPPKVDGRNARTVWSISTTPLADEHYAPMPVALAERCIKAGSKPGDVVLDPFAGSGTTARAAVVLQRSAVLIDLGYGDLQQRRTDGVQIAMVDLEAA